MHLEMSFAIREIMQARPITSETYDNIIHVESRAH